MEDKWFILKETCLLMAVKLAGFYLSVNAWSKAIDICLKGLAEDALHVGLNDAYIEVLLRRDERAAATFEVSDDNSNWSTVISKSDDVPVENATYDSTPYTYTLNASGRYIRLLFEDGSQNTTLAYVQLSEVGVFTRNVVIGGTATASSTAGAGFPASEGNDGVYHANDPTNAWASGENQDVMSWWKLDLGQTQDIGYVAIQFRGASGVYLYVPKSVTFQVSGDGSHWTTAILKSKEVPAEGSAYSETPYNYYLNASGRYLRLLFEEGTQSSAYKYVEFTEIEVHS